MMGAQPPAVEVGTGKVLVSTFQGEAYPQGPSTSLGGRTSPAKVDLAKTCPAGRDLQGILCPQAWRAVTAPL